MPALMLLSTVFASSGAWNPFAVLDTKTRILNSAKEMAIRPVRMPTILTEYESVVIRLITNVRTSTIITWVVISQVFRWSGNLIV